MVTIEWEKREGEKEKEKNGHCWIADALSWISVNEGEKNEMIDINIRV